MDHVRSMNSCDEELVSSAITLLYETLGWGEEWAKAIPELPR
jgi:hypothetical protein